MEAPIRQERSWPALQRARRAIVIADIVESVRAAAFEMQRRLQALNQGLEEERLIRLRIGLHVAEIVADEVDVYRAGVNLAARLADLRDPDAYRSARTPWTSCCREPTPFSRTRRHSGYRRKS
jgi:hypothetical protein